MKLGQTHFNTQGGLILPYSLTFHHTKMKISGTNLRMALVDRRGELIRCSSITKDNTFDEQIATLDNIIEQIWMAKNVELTVIN